MLNMLLLILALHELAPHKGCVSVDSGLSMFAVCYAQLHAMHTLPSAAEV